jgi:hypothetical protein
VPRLFPNIRFSQITKDGARIVHPPGTRTGPGGARARLDDELFGAGLEDQRRDLLGAVDADPGAAHPAARAVATELVRCQSDALDWTR